MSALTPNAIKQRKLLLKAVQKLQTFKDGLPQATGMLAAAPSILTVNISDFFLGVKDDADVLLTFVFKNVGVAAVTKGRLQTAEGILVKDLFGEGVKDGIIDFNIGKCGEIKSLFLDMTTTIVATPQTGTPVKLQCELQLANGNHKKKMKPGEAQFAKAGDVISCLTSIIIH